MDETFYILTVATADGGSADMHGPYPTATETLVAWTKIHGAQDPATDFAYVLAAQANGTLVLV